MNVLRRLRLRRFHVLGEGLRDCGPAALASVARFYGDRASLLRVQELVGADLQAASLDDLQHAAAVMGFDAAHGSLTPGHLESIALPLIAHLHREPHGHFVVLHALTNTRAVVIDPAVGVVQVPKAEFLSTWSRNVLLLRPSRDFVKRRKKRSTLLELLALARSERRLLMPSAWLAIVTAVLAYAVSLFVKMVVDDAVPHADVNLLAIAGVGVLAVVIVRAVFSALRQFLLTIVGYRVSLNLGGTYVRRLISLPTRFFDGHQSGELLTRFLEAPKITSAVTGPLLSVSLDSALLVAAGTLMVVYSPALTALTLCFVPAFLLVSMGFAPIIRRRERELRERFSRVTNRFVEVVGNIKMVKAFAREDAAHDEVLAAYADLQQVTARRANVALIMVACSAVLSGAGAVALVWYGGQQVLDHRLSIGELMFFYSVMTLFLGSADRLSGSLASIQEGGVGLERIRDIGVVPTEHQGPLFKFPSIGTCSRVECRHVSFEYRRNRPVLTDIDLTFGLGESVAILGETGSGKSTLLTLVNGLYPASSGSVLIDGRNVSDWDKVSLRRRTAFVSQDAALFSGTVRENISFGIPESPLSAVVAAARLAHADEFIRALPAEYDYQVGANGSGLSAGQRQRIAIARALLVDPAILILDEATSHLDPETEAAVVKAIWAESQRRITLFATHRIAVAAQAGRIVVLAGGHVIEMGTHHDLIEVNGRYAAMWASFHRHGDDVASDSRPNRHRVWLAR